MRYDDSLSSTLCQYPDLQSTFEKILLRDSLGMISFNFGSGYLSRIVLDPC